MEGKAGIVDPLGSKAGLKQKGFHLRSRKVLLMSNPTFCFTQGTALGRHKESATRLGQRASIAEKKERISDVLDQFGLGRNRRGFVLWRIAMWKRKKGS